MALGAPFHCCRLTPRRPLVSCLRGKVTRPKMVSSNQKRFQLCFVRSSPRGTSETRVFHQNENTARVRVMGDPFRKFTGAPKVPHGNGLVGSGWEARRDEPDREGTLPGRAPHSKE